MRRPLVGITCDFEMGDGSAAPFHFLKDSYVRAVERAGGVPLLLPHSNDREAIAAYLRVIQALIVSGGGCDVEPAHYGEEPLPGLGPANPPRTTFELTLVAAALERGRPILGICGGLQLLNVAAGGSLIQDIPTQVPRARQHRQTTPLSQPSHRVELSAGSRLARILGVTSLTVNSTHHQAIKEVAPAYRVCGMAEDGVIEAVEGSGEQGSSLVLGVQWHPEALLSDADIHTRLFRALVAAACPPP